MSSLSDIFPSISFIDNTTVDDVLNAMITDYKNKYYELEEKEASLAQAHPYRLIMYSCAMQIYQAMQYADYAGKMSFLTYAKDEFLDNLAALRGIQRKDAAAASVTLQFSIEEAIASAVAIPAGCRVTNGNDVFFATDEYAEIPAGETSVTVTATCTETGMAGNGFTAGEINVIVNTLPYVTSVTNLDTTYGGNDRETDDELRERIYEAPGGYSTTGPMDAYVYHTKNVSSDIGDVYVISEKPGEVDVYFIMADGSIPTDSMIADVEEYLSDKTIRPLTDYVKVQAPTVETYDINLTYYIAESSKSAVSTIQADVESAVSAYNIWQSEKIGRDINPSFLIQKIMEAGAKRVVVASPEYKVLNESTISQVGNVTITYGGVEDD